MASNPRRTAATGQHGKNGILLINPVVAEGIKISLQRKYQANQAAKFDTDLFERLLGDMLGRFIETFAELAPQKESRPSFHSPQAKFPYLR